MSELDQARDLVSASERILVLTGAGISTDSGIPDFRGPQGLWVRDPAAERLSSLEAYLSDPELRRRSWRGLVQAPVWQARPNAAHLALVELERRGKLELLVTQNTDGLHADAGHDPERLVEIHGSTRRTRCRSCGAELATAAVLERVRDGDDDPRCEAVVDGAVCGGMLKRTTILFGEQLVLEDLRRAQRAATRCDLLVAIGSTLSVNPAASLVPIAGHIGAAIVIVNGSPTEHDADAAVVVRAPIGEAVPAIVG